MKLKREPKPKADQRTYAEMVLGVFQAFEQNLERCRRLTENLQQAEHGATQRAEALQGAQEIAVVTRGIHEAILNLDLLENIPEAYSPIQAIAALARLGYALIALAEEQPEPQALLRLDELDGLVEQYQLQPWLDLFRTND